MVEVRKVFDSSGMCQFLDQVNALSELSHKNRLTYIGEGSVTVQTAELVTRDVNR